MREGTHENAAGLARIAIVSTAVSNLGKRSMGKGVIGRALRGLVCTFAHPTLADL
jgi:hypothetical protein